MKKLQVTRLGRHGVNVTRSPLHLTDEELVNAQNAETRAEQGLSAVVKRGGLSLFTSLDGALFALFSAGVLAPVTEDTYMRCRIYSTVNQPLVDTELTTLEFNIEDYDVGALHDVVTNPDRITIPTGGDGLYLIGGQFSVSTSATGRKSIQLFKNDSERFGISEVMGDDGGLALSMQAWAVINLVAGDFVTCKVRQDSGGPLSALGGAADLCSMTAIRLLATS